LRQIPFFSPFFFFPSLLFPRRMRLRGAYGASRSPLFFLPPPLLFFFPFFPPSYPIPPLRFFMPLLRLSIFSLHSRRLFFDHICYACSLLFSALTCLFPPTPLSAFPLLPPTPPLSILPRQAPPLLHTYFASCTYFFHLRTPTIPLQTSLFLPSTSPAASSLLSNLLSPPSF